MMRIRRVLWGYDPREVLEIKSLYQSEKLFIEREVWKRAKQMSAEREEWTARVKQRTAERNQLLAEERRIAQPMGDP